MTRRATLLLFSVFGVLNVLVSLSGAIAAPPQTSRGAQTTSESFTATVRALDAEAYTLDVITGVGHAFRLLRVQVSPTCQVRVAGAAAKLGDLKVGAICRIQYRKTPEGLLAEKIEKVDVAATGSKR